MNVTSATAATIRSILANLASKAARCEHHCELAVWSLDNDPRVLREESDTDESLVGNIREASKDADELFEVAKILRESLQDLGGYTLEAKEDFGVVCDAQSFCWGNLMVRSGRMWTAEAV